MIKKSNIIILSLLCVLYCACSSDNDDDTKDMTFPVISDSGITANPVDCQVYHRGESIPFLYVFTDNMELGSYNIEVHNNFDHHTHSSSSVECEQEAKKEPVKPWIFNQDYTIPAGQRSYTAKVSIPIPADVDPGDYHFMIRLTDKAGWQTLKAMAVKIAE